MRIGLQVILAALLTGCTHYEYDLTQPPDLAQHVGQKSDVVVRIDPLEYRLRSYEDVLVMRVFNPTNEMVQLLGGQSAVVDPRGQSHPLRNQAIAPHSYIKLLFPPPRPDYYYHPGPTFGIGVGTVVGHGNCVPPRGRALCDPWDRFYGEGAFAAPMPPPPVPRYLDDAADDGTFYWSWDGPGEIRMTIVYQQGEKMWRNDFTFRRSKPK